MINSLWFHLQKNLFGRVWVEKVFRGRPVEGVVELSKVAYKNDFKLVAKDEEQDYIRQTKPLEEALNDVKLLPEFLEFPPLLKVNFFCLYRHHSII